ncbi:NAD(P)H-dependent oxidoreductase [Cellulomonas marina]|uniref:Predicted homoserine dehydrogenase, contains C-terminal SAF domain n=1 Tax=Cellulomonas marina TaxID=988821 RepID=A0A1I1ADC0_9CELL|nr:NAD(P)-dependent oxidoreductase [Cellulomonas marina]GIG29717.1 strU protein [Cellulomonas marina]SFB35984.1 Predicted homoserine dehydrogenase, contains C-terminal SAF domain [Cellulomonas marina]
MILLDTALAGRQAEGRPIRVGMVGAGFQGKGFANQVVNSVPGMTLVAVANRTVERGVAAYAYAGVEDVEVVSAADAFDRAIAHGRPAVTDDWSLLVGSDAVDCLVDVTGAVEFGAHLTVAAIEAGKPLVTMNAELDGTVGPLLAERARRAGVVLTGADGDQPGVEMNLLRFVRGIGATPLVAGNIKGLQDPYRNPTTQKGFAERWGQDPAMVTSFADGTKISFEQAIVANAAGFTVPRRGMNGWDHAGHVDELVSRYDVDELVALGGVVDYVVGSKPGPGVFVLATHDDPKQQHYLNLYKLGEGPLYSFYTPYHLCHFEVPNTVVRAVDFADPALAPTGGPRVEVVTTAKRDLPAGHVLDGLGGYDTYGQAEDYPRARAADLLPQGVAVDCRLRRAVAKDEVLTYADVELPAGRLVDRLREEQTALFG